MQGKKVRTAVPRYSIDQFIAFCFADFPRQRVQYGEITTDVNFQ